MKLFYFLLALFIEINNCFAQCNPEKTKIMILGDSWAFFSWTNNSYNENLDRFGFTDIRANSNIDISVTGLRAGNYFSDNERKQAVVDFLAAHPDVGYCHISLGGNDVMGEWNTSMTSAQEDAMLNKLMKNLRCVIDTLMSIRPGIKVILSGYDYPNFVETAALSSLHPYYQQWTDMGQPDAFEMNSALSTMIHRYVDSAITWTNVYFVNNLGLMQWYYGQTTPMIIPPYITYPAHSVPLPGGNMNYPSPRVAFMLGGADSFHLGDDGFEIFIERQFEEYYWYALRNPDTSIFPDDVLLNGYVTPTSQNSGIIKSGRIADEETQGIITFNTSSLNAGLGISSASIFLKRKDLSGTNLVNQELVLGIKENFFGASPAVENDYFNSCSDAEGSVCTYGTMAHNDYWMRIDIPPSFLSYINKSGYTQFKLKFNTIETNNYFEFSNFADIKNQPVLDVNYDSLTLYTENLKSPNIAIYPNPAGDYLTIETETKTKEPAGKADRIEIINQAGQAVKNLELKNCKSTFCIKDLTSGFYTLRIFTTKGIYVTKFIKE